MSAESSKKPTVAARATAARKRAVVPAAAGAADPISRTGLQGGFCARGIRKARIAAPRRAGNAAGGAPQATVCPAWHSTQAPRLTVPSMAPSEAFGAD